MNHPERRLQQQVVVYLHVALSLPPQGPAWTAVNPNPPKGRIGGAIAKSMGLRAGWPDVIGLWQGRMFGIELKAKNGSLSEAQKNAHAEIIANGGAVATCKSIDEVVAFLDSLNIPLRARP